MIDEIKLKNFGPISDLHWSKIGKINVIIGKNDSGKTFLLKALYSAVKSLEKYKRGDEPEDNLATILKNKLRWTFQIKELGKHLVTKGENSLSCLIKINGKNFIYDFGKDTVSKISSIEYHSENRESNSIFLPPKEVLSIHKIIGKSREIDSLFGFDDTYYDLASVLSSLPTRGRNYGVFSKARTELENILEGKIQYDKGSDDWYFRKDSKNFSIHLTAEGIKKIGILDTLLANSYLTPSSIVFIDEPESALHPEAISKLMDIIAMLADAGIQFFIATHSYFVIKKLHLIAMQGSKPSIPIISANNENKWISDNLKDGMPNNSIIDESIRLYEEYVNEVMDNEDD